MSRAPQAQPSADFAIELLAVHQQFGRTPILRGVHLQVRPGERVALIGPNGAGKSSLFDVISGRCAPSSGQIKLHGQRIDGLAPYQINRRGLSRSFQISHLFGHLSVFDNLRCAVLWSLGHRYAFWQQLSRLQRANARAEQVLAQVQLQGRRAHLAMDLTHAEQRALDIGITLAGGANVLLLDEPTAGMSQSETARFIPLIRTLTQGKTLLMVEHDMDVVFGLADRIAVLVQGQVIAFDLPEAVRHNPQVQQAYLGSLPTDALAAKQAAMQCAMQAATQSAEAGH